MKKTIITTICLILIILSLTTVALDKILPIEDENLKPAPIEDFEPKDTYNYKIGDVIEDTLTNEITINYQITLDNNQPIIRTLTLSSDYLYDEEYILSQVKEEVGKVITEHERIQTETKHESKKITYKNLNIPKTDIIFDKTKYIEEKETLKNNLG